MTKNFYDLKAIKKILQSIRESSRDNLGQNISSPLAEEFLLWLGSFAQYCIPEKSGKWQNNIRNILYSPIINNDKFNIDEYSLIDNLYNYMNAGRIMQVYAHTHSWNEIKLLLGGHSGWSFLGLANILIEYSLIGPEFIEKFNPNRLMWDKEFKKQYNEAKEYILVRQNLNQRLIRSLTLKK